MVIFKLCRREAWQEAEAKGRFLGAPVDLQDGFIHFSTAAQVRETAAKHFRMQDDLVVVAVDADRLGDALRWEVSRGGALFPHLYRALAASEAIWVKDLPMLTDGSHDFTGMI
jgi:uncharacterized protein (DUF952 family)